MSAIDYAKRSEQTSTRRRRALQRALEHWQPQFLQWWHEMGERFRRRGGLSAHRDLGRRAGLGALWKSQNADYRWGIFLADRSRAQDRLRRRHGQPAWQQVPGEYRSTLRRLIVTRATPSRRRRAAAPAGHTCPSLMTCATCSRINVEEGRHLWAMVYLLHAYFGRDGREEAEELLARHSGDADKPRI